MRAWKEFLSSCRSLGDFGGCVWFLSKERRGNRERIILMDLMNVHSYTQTAFIEHPLSVRHEQTLWTFSEGNGYGPRHSVGGYGLGTQSSSASAEALLYSVEVVSALSTELRNTRLENVQAFAIIEADLRKVVKMSIDSYVHGSFPQEALGYPLVKGGIWHESILAQLPFWEKLQPLLQNSLVVTSSASPTNNEWPCPSPSNSLRSPPDQCVLVLVPHLHTCRCSPALNFCTGFVFCFHSWSPSHLPTFVYLPTPFLNTPLNWPWLAAPFYRFVISDYSTQSSQAILLTPIPPSRQASGSHNKTWIWRNGLENWGKEIRGA